eukprot:TRINITY_DN20825_c0_g1_i2.p1 TRINITY_DN20825_c0_g1~~TRINITY_DN20825_c0_g1_i2.p1  ORF type:complete len:246 (+),score=47.44 TRINITY_DN20825_c0_g1_i2:99-740(+)
MGLRSPSQVGMEDVERAVKARVDKEKVAEMEAMMRELERLREARAAEAERGEPEEPGTEPTTVETKHGFFVNATTLVISFMGLYFGSLAAIFTLTDHGVPIPPVEIGRRARIPRDPYNVMLSYAPMLALPAAALTIIARPHVIPMVAKHFKDTRQGLYEIFTVNNKGATAASRGAHVSGVTKLRKKPVNPNWNEKGADIGVIFGGGVGQGRGR